MIRPVKTSTDPSVFSIFPTPPNCSSPATSFHLSGFHILLSSVSLLDATYSIHSFHPASNRSNVDTLSLVPPSHFLIDSIDPN